MYVCLSHCILEKYPNECRSEFVLFDTIAVLSSQEKCQSVEQIIDGRLSLELCGKWKTL